jgi:hypothetical protein
MSGTPHRIGAGAPANPSPDAHPPEGPTPPGTSATPQPGPAAFGELPARTSQAASAPRAALPAADAPHEEIDAFVDSLNAMAPIRLEPAPIAVPRVPSEEVLRVLLETARVKGDREVTKQTIGYQALRGAAGVGPSPVERMHNAINALPHDTHPGLSDIDRALLYRGAAASGIAGLARSNSNVSRATFAQAYLKAANLMPTDLELPVPHGTESASLHTIALLPQADQAMYMQVVPPAGLTATDTRRLRDSMKAYFEVTGDSLSSDLCNPACGPTFAARAEFITNRLRAAGKRTGGITRVAAYLEARPDAAPASGQG